MEKFIEDLEEILETDSGVITLQTTLKDLEEWDSLAHVSFIALADGDYSKIISGEDLIKCEKVEDLYQLLS